MALWCCPFSIQGHKSYFTVISWDVKCCHWKSFKMKIVLLIFFFFSVEGIGGKEVITGDPEFVPCLQQTIEKKILRKVGKLLKISRGDSTHDSALHSAVF